MIDKTNILYPRPNFPQARGNYMEGGKDGASYEACLNFVAAGNGDETLNTELNSHENDLVIDETISNFNGGIQEFSYKCNNTELYDQISRRLSSRMGDVDAVSALLGMAAAPPPAAAAAGGTAAAPPPAAAAAGGTDAASGLGASSFAQRVWNALPSLQRPPPDATEARQGAEMARQRAAEMARQRADAMARQRADDAMARSSASADSDYGGASKSGRYHPYGKSGGGRKYSSKKPRKNKSRKNKSRTKKRKYRTRKYKN